MHDDTVAAAVYLVKIFIGAFFPKGLEYEHNNCNSHIVMQVGVCVPISVCQACVSKRDD